MSKSSSNSSCVQISSSEARLSTNRGLLGVENAGVDSVSAFLFLSKQEAAQGFTSCGTGVSCLSELQVADDDDFVLALSGSGR